MPATWDIEDYGDFSLTLSRNHSPEQVLAAYGAEPGEARLMSESQCDTEIEVNLSDGSEAFSLSRTGHSMTVFKYAQYGQFCEWFEPRNHQTVQGGSPHAFFQRIQNMPSDTSAAMASLKVMSEHVGAELTPEILKGPPTHSEHHKYRPRSPGATCTEFPDYVTGRHAKRPGPPLGNDWVTASLGSRAW